MPDPETSRTRRLNKGGRQMVAKLLIAALAMFGFGYALVPIYRAVCDALGINVLSVSSSPTSTRGSVPGEHAGRRQPDGYRRIRR